MSGNMVRPDWDLDVLWRPLTQHASQQRPLVIVSGKGVRVVDSAGREYIDAMAGIWCVNVGYGEERIVRAAAEQMLRLPYTPLTRPSPPALRLAERLVGLLPAGLRHVQFLNSGSEAVEDALRVARQAQRQRHPRENRSKVIARYRGYHGWTLGALGATGQVGRKERVEPLLPGYVHISPPDTFRLFAGLSPSEATDRLLAELEQTIEFEGPSTIAAMIGEPIIGGGGVIVPPDDYWPRVRQLCDRYDILLIFDEVITGFGRTGTWFGGQNWGVTPDIMTMAKGLSSGYMPLAAMAASDAVFDAFKGQPADGVEYAQISTFGGHPVACAAGLENLRLLAELNLVDNAAQMGALFGAGLRALRDKFPLIGDVRGKGLMWGVELVLPGGLEPLPAAKVNQVLAELQKRGVLAGKNSSTVPRLENVLTFAPPLIVKSEEIDQIVGTLGEAVQAVQGQR
ncbi:MAG: aminotransferase class III-fold pyridoxal phosphate-dependent enzyme [Chloroflexi bacterium]|nr:aminotransferase class III-fold pyridoxal phosphate-dependent enzyme [Chloroflexota bacterium]MCL5110296.1 aminotransferase class III-fold pyridoxal phosphate-dependent enzyme [Chloroflexota bacterium]